jgi:hypothetical protein
VGRWVDVAVFEHPVFAREPFTEREAWWWPIGEAEWRRDGRQRRVDRSVVLGRSHAVRPDLIRWDVTVFLRVSLVK